MYNGAGSSPTALKSERYRAFILACGKHAFETEVRMGGGKLATKRPSPKSPKR